MTEQEKYEAFHLMKEMGGGFATRLADAWFYADSGNKEKIETAFADMLRRYAAMTERHRPQAD